MDEKNLQPLKTLGEAILNPETVDILTDYAEISIDAFFENPFFKEIPFVRTLRSLGKLGTSIKDIFELKKQMVFLRQLHAGDINKEELSRRNSAFQNEEDWFYKEVENLVVYLSRYARVEKAKVQAELYIDLINQVIDLDKFNECLEILDTILVSDFEMLIDVYREQSHICVPSDNLYEDLKDVNTSFDYIKCGRLTAAGLVCPLSRGISFGTQPARNYLITDLGKYFSTVLIRTFN